MRPQKLLFSNILKQNKQHTHSLYFGLNLHGGNVSELQIENGEKPEDYHVTLLWGKFTPRSDMDDTVCRIQSVMEEIKNDIPKQVVFYHERRFEASESSDNKDVIVAAVAGGVLEPVHKKLLSVLKNEKIEVEKTFPVYVPHLTLAYVEPGSEHELRVLDHSAMVKDVTVCIKNIATGEKEYERVFEMVAKSFSEVLKFNQNHDKLGRFCSGSGGGSVGTSYKIQFGFGSKKREFETDKITADFYEKQKENAAMLIMSDSKKEILGPIKDFYAPYQKGIANKDNYYVGTIAEFKETKRPRRPPDYVSRTKDGKISSEYWYTEKGVIRGSKHWGKEVASCDWFLEGQGTDMNGRKQYGECQWKDFTQKTSIVTSESSGKATISTFENTVGGFKMRHGMTTPIVSAFNEEVAKSFSDIIKFNPYHDSRGRFTTAGTAASFTYRPGASVAHDRAIARESERVKQVDKVVAGTDKMASYVIENQFISSEKKQCIKDVQNCYQSIALKNSVRWDAEKNKVIAKRSAIFEMKDTARKIMEKQEYEDTTTSQEYYELHRTIKRTPIKISDYDKQNIPDWNDYRRRAFGNLTISNNGLSIDSFYQELSSQFPHLFDSHRETSPSDQLEKLNEVLTSLKPRTYTLKGRELEEAADDLALQMLNGYVAVIRP